MAKEPMSSILVTIWITVRIQESEVRNPHYCIDYRKSYQRILMKFYGELECSLETNRLHFGVDPQIQPPLLPNSITCNCSTPVSATSVAFHRMVSSTSIQSPLGVAENSFTDKRKLINPLSSIHRLVLFLSDVYRFTGPFYTVNETIPREARRVLLNCQ